MDLNELNEFIKTDEGVSWLEEQKKPLLQNRDNLLTELKSTSSKLSETEQRLVQTENGLSEERHAMSKLLIDDALTALLKKAGVFDQLLETTAKSIKERYALTVKADGNNRQAVGMNDDNEIALVDLVDHWSKLNEAKQVIENRNTGGGAQGSSYNSRMTTTNNANLSNEQLVKMTEAEFTQWKQSLLNKQG